MIDALVSGNRSALRYTVNCYEHYHHELEEYRGGNLLASHVFLTFDGANRG